ncbi:MAG: GtrA family protein [Chitinophagaceae bacterium]|nr:GtrA family protein [Rubrivivax sp.]
MAEPAPAPARTGATHQLAAFALVGLANTLIHLVVVMLLVEQAGLAAVPANGLAFAVANGFSFWANGRYTFRSAPTRWRYARFLGVSLTGLALSLAASAWAARMHWHYLAGVALTFLLLPLLSFAAHRWWTWRGVPA